MNKIKNYIIALYASGVVGLADVGYVTYNVIKDKTITEKTVNIMGVGLGAYIFLWGTGTIGFALDNKSKIKQNKLEENLIK
jgi:hypothetical protein